MTDLRFSKVNTELLPIASLTRPITSPETKSIRGIVLHLWPSSSLKRSTTLLLGETNIPPHESKGQVLVVLRGHSAELVRAFEVEIGNVVILGLDGARWVENTGIENGVGTSGQRMEWGLQFDRRIFLHVSVHLERIHLFGLRADTSGKGRPQLKRVGVSRS